MSPVFLPGHAGTQKGGNHINVIKYLGLGIGHERRGEGCQDFLAHRNAKNGNVILALSDGAGQAAFAHDASRINCESIVELFDRLPLEEFLSLEPEVQVQRTLEACLTRLKEFLIRRSVSDVAQVSATLLFAVITKKHLLVGHIGDGSIYCMAPDGTMTFASEPENIGKVSNRTYFTVSRDAAAHLHLTTLDLEETPVCTVFMTSDGTKRLLHNLMGGDPAASAKAFMDCVRTGEMRTNEDLARELRQNAMANERLDDWSILLWDRDQEDLDTPFPPIVSMLKEEERKLRPDDKEMPAPEADAPAPAAKNDIPPAKEPVPHPSGSTSEPERTPEGKSEEKPRKTPDTQQQPETDAAPRKSGRSRFVWQLPNGATITFSPGKSPSKPQPNRDPQPVRQRKPVSLTAYLSEHPAVPERFFLYMLISVCRALLYYERSHCVHLNVHPDNIFIFVNEGKYTFRLGLRADDRVLSDFTAPEVLDDRLPRGVSNPDLFSLAASMYYLLTNVSPWYFFRTGQRLPYIEKLSPDFAAILCKAAQYDPQRRYRSAADLLADLQQLL